MRNFNDWLCFLGVAWSTVALLACVCSRFARGLASILLSRAEALDVARQTYGECRQKQIVLRGTGSIEEDAYRCAEVFRQAQILRELGQGERIKVMR